MSSVDKPTGPGSRLALFPILTLSAFCIPILIGLAGTWLPALGYLPAIGAYDLNVSVFFTLFREPGFSSATFHTITTGLGATLIALGLSLLITIQIYGTSLWRLLERSLAVLLAMPHAAFAIGFGFLIAPSGWLVRIISPELTGFEVPPGWATVKDAYGISLTLALAFKEIPFLLLMCLSGLNQLDIRRTLWVGHSLGYSRSRIWTRLVLPQLYPHLRLPVLAVLAYSLSVVDVALILGPNLPPTLSVLVDRWFNDSDVGYRLLGAAGATWLFLLVMAAIAVFLLAEKIINRLSRDRLIDGSRSSISERFGLSGATAYFSSALLLLVSLLSFLVLVLWSFTRSWRFPESLPGVYSLRFWARGVSQTAEPVWIALVVGVLATLIAVVLVIGCLENEIELARKGRRADSQKVMWLVYLPLLVPQIAFLFGIQTIAVLFGVEGTWLSMVGVHLIFVLPYVFLTLSGVYRGFDNRYTQVAVSLSGSPLRSFFRVKLVMLAKPIVFALATGFAVSVAQYLPTMYLGAGRFMTITTETVSLAGGSDRRVVAVYALCQFLLPMLMYTLAIFLPAWAFRNRRAMQNEKGEW